MNWRLNYNKLNRENMESDEDIQSYSKHRNPCKRWTKDQDNRLIYLVNKYKYNWKEIGHVMGNKPAKSCRERWVNQVNPNINRNPFSLEEEWMLFLGVQFYGTKWCEISTMFQNRPDKQIKNYWQTNRMRKRAEEFKQRVKQIFLEKCLQQIRSSKETSF